MISAQNVYNTFITFASPDSSEGTEKILSLCSSSLENLMKALSDTADKNDSRIAYAAACDAYYIYALSQMTDASENADMKAGDVTVKQNIKDTLSVAKEIKEKGERTVRELLRDNSFGVWSI